MKFARRLTEWFDRNKRDLPWRHTRDPYRILVSEVMLQQTRVAAVIPFYLRFIERYPDFETLAASSESELLAMWAGLGYYSRARNLQKAARRMLNYGAFPTDYDGIRALPGVGEYTAAAVASIAFGLPYIGLDGNIVRVIARHTAEGNDARSPETRSRLLQIAQSRMDRSDPGTYKQSLMELGATICLPRSPKCVYCPINDDCGAKLQGLEETLPILSSKTKPISEEKTLLWIERNGCVLLWQREAGSRRLAGFWELPEADNLPDCQTGPALGSFRHAIVNHVYRISLFEGKLFDGGGGLTLYQWVAVADLKTLPISTMLRKSLKFIDERPRLAQAKGV